MYDMQYITHTYIYASIYLLDQQDSNKIMKLRITSNYTIFLQQCDDIGSQSVEEEFVCMPYEEKIQ